MATDALGMSGVMSDEVIENIDYIGDVAVYYLRKGEKLSKTAPGTSDTEFDSFTRVAIRMLCAGRGISYELGFADMSQVNYATFRAALQKDYKHLDMISSSLENEVLDVIVEKWLENEIMIGSFPGIKYSDFKANPDRYFEVMYIGPERITVDPLKERLAEERAVKNNRSTQSEIAQKAGRTFESIVAQKEEELEILDRYGFKMTEKGEIVPKNALA
jgi:capsid protein